MSWLVITNIWTVLYAEGVHVDWHLTVIYLNTFPSTLNYFGLPFHFPTVGESQASSVGQAESNWGCETNDTWMIVCPSIACWHIKGKTIDTVANWIHAVVRDKLQRQLNPMSYISCFHISMTECCVGLSDVCQCQCSSRVTRRQLKR